MPEMSGKVEGSLRAIYQIDAVPFEMHSQIKTNEGGNQMLLVVNSSVSELIEQR